MFRYMLDSKKKKEKKGMKIARSIKRKKISARERERERRLVRDGKAGFHLNS